MSGLLSRHVRPHGQAKSLRRVFAFFTGLMAMTVIACAPASKPEPPVVTIFAAASLTEALGQIAEDYERQTGQAVRLSFAGSGSVARQVEAGAPADIVILADQSWMDRLGKAGRLSSSSRVDLLGNRLVLISGAEMETPPVEPLSWLVQTEGRLAVGDPDSVPAGSYARNWLQAIGRWEALEPYLVTGADVRAVRTFVERGEAALGVVYRSDVVGAPGVRVIAEPPASQQPKIVYPAALTTVAKPEAAPLLQYLRSPQADAVFVRHGFEPHP